MEMIKLRIAKAKVNDTECLIVAIIDKDGMKQDMTLAEIDGDGQAELILHDKRGYMHVTSREEVGYEDFIDDEEEEC